MILRYAWRFANIKLTTHHTPAFSKVKKPDQRFVDVIAGYTSLRAMFLLALILAILPTFSVEITEENINSIEKYYQRLLKCYEETGGDLEGMGLVVGGLVESEPANDALARFGHALTSAASAYKALVGGTVCVRCVCFVDSVYVITIVRQGREGVHGCAPRATGLLPVHQGIPTTYRIMPLQITLKLPLSLSGCPESTRPEANRF